METVVVPENCLGVIMPVFNEKKTLHLIVERVLSRPEVGELIMVDDASTDGTWQRMQELEKTDTRIRIFRCEANRGKGAALRIGFSHAVSEILVVQDADLEYDPDEYPKLLLPILAGKADVVYGSRFQGSGIHRVFGFWHSLGNKLLTLMSNMCTNLNLTDMETCYKMFKKSIIDRIQLREDRFGFEPEFTAKVSKLGVPIYEVSISYHGRTYEDGKKIGWKDGVSAIWCILKYRFE
jgi:glycosyltransferase involved in cell wall biosynthesis